MMVISDRLCAIREQKDLSQGDIEQRTGLKRCYVSRVENGHTVPSIGPVHFQARNLDMWLPQNAEVHYDWRGRRSHRRHSFRNYLLFAVDDKTTHLGAQGRRPGEIIS